MADVRTMYDKEFIYAYNLGGKDVTVTIERIKGGELTGTGGKKTKKPVLYFKGSKKGFALNITNARIIGALFGTFETEAWIGKRITLYPTTTTFGSDTVECIRVRNKAPKAGEATGQLQEDATPPDRVGGEDDHPEEATA